MGTVPRAHHGGYSVGGFFSNFGHGAENAFLGLVPGAKTAAGALWHDITNPTLDIGKSETYKKILKPIGEKYARTYGPLLHGDASQLYQDPFGVLLDVFTAATLGGGMGAKIATKLAPESRLARYVEPRQIAYTTPAMLAGDAGAAPVLGKSLLRNPVGRARQLGANKIANLAPYDFPVIGEGARAARAQVRDAKVADLGVRQQAAQFSGALAKLDPAERKAFYPLSVLPLPRSLGNWQGLLSEARDAAAGEQAHIQGLLRIGTPDVATAASWKGRLSELDAAVARFDDLTKTLADPKVRAAYENPSPALLAAHAAADKLGQAMVNTATRLGTMSRDEADLAKWRQMRLADGAAVYTASTARSARGRIDTQLRKLGKTQAQIQKLSDELRTKGTPELQAFRGQVTKAEDVAAAARRGQAKLGDAGSRVDTLQAKLAKARDDLTVAMGAGTSSAADSRYLGSLLGQTRALSEQYDHALANLIVTHHKFFPAGDLPGDLARRRSAESAQYAQMRSDIASRLVAGRDELERVAAATDELAKRRGEIKAGIVGGDIGALKAELAAAGRPEPIYMPDLPAVQAPRASVRGAGAVAVGSPIHQSTGLHFLTGQVALDPTVLNQRFLRDVAYTHYRDIVDRMLNVAVPVRGRRGPEGKLVFDRPAGHVWVKKPKQIADLNVDELSAARINPSDLFDKSGDLAHVDHANAYAIPERMASTFGQEFQRSERASRWLIDKPLDVWRAFILKTRIGWLVNNMVGNSIMYGLQYGGPAGQLAYLRMILNAKGPATVRAMLKIGDPNGISKELFESAFPEQAGGTFIATQMPAIGSRTKLMRAVSFPTKPLVKADRSYEYGLRKAAAEAALRKTPEFRAMSRKLRDETRDFNTIARKTMDETPVVQREISDKVNAALGNFLNLSPLERNGLRRLAPFYAWYKAISVVTLKLVFDTPGRADALAKIGQIGEEQLQEIFGGQVQSFLRGFVPFGPGSGGKVPGVNMTAANPYSTSVQVGKALAGLAAGQPGEAGAAVGGELNPFVQGAIEWMSGRSLFTGGRAHPSGVPGLPGYVLGNIVRGLPQVKPVERAISGPIESPLYGKRDVISELLRSTGLAPVEINKARARQTARQGH